MAPGVANLKLKCFQYLALCFAIYHKEMVAKNSRSFLIHLDHKTLSACGLSQCNLVLFWYESLIICSFVFFKSILRDSKYCRAYPSILQSPQKYIYSISQHLVLQVLVNVINVVKKCCRYKHKLVSRIHAQACLYICGKFILIGQMFSTFR